VTARGKGPPSLRQTELLERAYRYVLTNGLVGMSLRPLAEAIGSSPRVLLFLFGSKDDLVRALLARARADERAVLDAVQGERGTLREAAARTWEWLADPAHRQLLVLWAEAYVQSLVDPDGPWAGFAADTVTDWLSLLGESQAAEHRDTAAGIAERTAALAMLRGALLDLLATGDQGRTAAAVGAGASALVAQPESGSAE
jgi:AcrR family transcriptional regulator